MSLVTVSTKLVLIAGAPGARYFFLDSRIHPPQPHRSPARRGLVSNREGHDQGFALFNPPSRPAVLGPAVRPSRKALRVPADAFACR